MIDFGAIEAAEATHTPFPYLCAKSVLSQADLGAVSADFPRIDKPGVFPLSSLEYGPGFAALIEDVRSSKLARAVGKKFGVELEGLPLMITVRGHAQAKDGRIHTDTKEKVVTCLLYLNDAWDDSGGRLRLLRNGENLEDYIAEIPPNGGTFVAFKVSPNSWHGHKPFVGQRRYIMFNWVVSDAALSRQLGRHKLSAAIKKFVPSYYKGK